VATRISAAPVTPARGDFKSRERGDRDSGDRCYAASRTRAGGGEVTKREGGGGDGAGDDCWQCAGATGADCGDAASREGGGDRDQLCSSEVTSRERGVGGDVVNRERGDEDRRCASAGAAGCAFASPEGGGGGSDGDQRCATDVTSRKRNVVFGDRDRGKRGTAGGDVASLEDGGRGVGDRHCTGATRANRRGTSAPGVAGGEVASEREGRDGDRDQRCVSDIASRGGGVGGGDDQRCAGVCTSGGDVASRENIGGGGDGDRRCTGDGDQRCARATSGAAGAGTTRAGGDDVASREPCGGDGDGDRPCSGDVASSERGVGGRDEDQR